MKKKIGKEMEMGDFWRRKEVGVEHIHSNMHNSITLYIWTLEEIVEDFSLRLLMEGVVFKCVNFWKQIFLIKKKKKTKTQIIAVFGLRNLSRGQKLMYI